MEFTRKRIRGRRQESYREWWDETESYRITWRNEFHGIQVAPAFHAMVRVHLTGHEYIDFAGERRPYRTFKAAIHAAERHRKTWLKLLEIAAGPFKGRADRIRELDARARFGVSDEACRLLAVQPAWAIGQVPSTLTRILYGSPTDDREDPSSVSMSSAESILPSSSETTDCDTPVESVLDSKPCTPSPTVPENSPKANTNRVRIAKEPDAPHEPSSKSRTGKRSKRGVQTVELMTA